jgi:hypothetical protein
MNRNNFGVVREEAREDRESEAKPEDFKKMSRRTLIALGYAAVAIAAPASAQDVGYNPHHAFVPDSQTAVVIGRAVLIPIYGRQTIQSEEPLTAKRQGDVWTVSGTLHCGGTSCVGGTAEVRLSAKDGRVLHVTHYQ